MASDQLKKEIYTHKFPFNIYALGWSNRSEKDKKFRLAVGSFKEEYSNVVKLLQLNPAKGGFEVFASINHPYPATQVLWSSHPTDSKDLLATTGDYLRLWSVDGIDSGSTSGVSLERGFNNNKHSEYCAPITSFDWNSVDTNIIGTSSVDTTCTIWDIEAGKATIQLIAHDKEVYDLSFATSDKNMFASAGADGSIRMFDLRSLEHSTIMFDSGGAPLIRLQWNKCDPNYIAAVELDSVHVVLLDIRKQYVGKKDMCLKGHSSSVNSISWAPHSPKHICTAGEDQQALIWDLSDSPKTSPVEPILSYQATGSINKMQWSTVHPDWVAIAYEKSLQILRV